MAASKNKTLRNLLRFSSRYHQNSVSAGTTSFTVANQAGVSLRATEIFRSLHTPSIMGQGEPKDVGDTRNQAFETLRRLGVQVSVKNCEAVIKDSIAGVYLPYQRGGEEHSRARIRSAIKFLKEEGLSIQEGMYSPRLSYLIDNKMVDEFEFLIKTLREEIPDSSSGLGYYEMLLWIELEDEQKINEIGWKIIDRWGELSAVEVNYLEAFCVTHEYKFLETLLETVDITKASSLDQLTPIFGYLGRSEMESSALRLLGELKRTARPEHISHLIYSYATNKEYEDHRIYGEEGAIEMCCKLHKRLEVKPSLELFERLMTFECVPQSYSKVPNAAKIVDEMGKNGLIKKSDKARYFYVTIKRIYGADWLKASEDVISDMGSKTFKINNFFCLFPAYMSRTRRRTRSRRETEYDYVSEDESDDTAETIRC